MKKRVILTLMLGLAVAAAGSGAPQETPPDDFSQAFVPDRPWEVIEVAILLDASGSMKHLLDATRIKLWDLVNDLTLAEPTPRLRVALVTFGHKDSPRDAGWVKVETDFTEDLDLVSERLFSLGSDGGAEYVGRALQTALDELTWAEDAGPLRLLFVAGNEPADQDPEVSFRAMSEEAFARGVEVNAVFCGSGQHEQAATWKEIAELGRGHFATVNHRRGPVIVETPFDEELAELGAAMNETYVPFGEDGRARRTSQRRQDENARKVSPAIAASRAQAKSSPLYAPEWDLVDAVAAEKVALHELEDSELPAEMRQMGFNELYLRLDELRLEREELRRRIAELGRERSEYIADHYAAEGIDDSWSFDSVLRRVIRERAEEKGFSFPE